MKKVFILLVTLFAMTTAGTGLKAQEVTIRLMPGWNLISYPYPETVSLETFFGNYSPMDGDMIESQFGYSDYDGGEWFGEVDNMKPGKGYLYYSNRTAPLNIVLGNPIVLPTVTTASATNITTYGLTCGGEVTDSGNSGVLVRGVCWSTQQNPTINDPHTTDGYGMGSFSSAVEGLEMNTTYYVRAYAMTTSGTGYGEQIMFSTKNGVPMLTTSAASEIGTTWATCGGDISDDGGIEVTERGICWSTEHNPTIEGDHSANGAGMGSFSVSLNNLEPNTTYYVRAYAINSHATAYGNEVFFRTEVAQTWQNGILPGEFSVSATHQVQFSQGNLQYQASTNSWRFASDQWEYVGADNANISATYDGYIDLFGWGTSGWDNGNIYYHPYDYEYLTDWNASDYAYGYGPTDGTNYNYGLTGDYANADWGVYNAILNGGNASHQWRTLTSSEWNYVFNTRTTTSGIRYAKAQVYGVNGIVLVPDDWNSSIYTLNYTNRTDAPFSTNVIADADWATMENNGVVFLPAAGYRGGGTYVSSAGSYGYYWSSNSASCLYFYNSNGPYTTGCSRYSGRSVRLVSVTLPEVSTMDVIDASGKSAIVGGNITEDGDADLSAWGVCYSTTHNPTVDNFVTLAQGESIGEFNVTLNGLTPNTTYYARAFATNSGGTAYGDEISFTTLAASQSWTNGTLPGGFSVSATQQMQFSQGNLQYIGSAATPYWRFAENQWDYLGTTTGQNSDNINVDRDLFCWGTSGYDHGASCYQPWSTSTNYSDYYAYGSDTYNLYDQTGEADWGYNLISNGGNQPNHWRTLTSQEWNYVLNTRSTTSGIRYVKAKVFGVTGVVLLPDDWSESIYTLNNTNNSGASFSSNVITASQWYALESAGAVFLPTAGCRDWTSVYDVGSYGSYWSASCSTDYVAYDMTFCGSYLISQRIGSRSLGLSVRLVRNIPVYSIEATPNPADGGTVTGQGNYNSDAICTLNATPNEGYVFSNWTENGTVVSTEALYSFTVSSDRTLVANFMQVPTGAIAGLFTVNSNGSKVYFSQGNLQYIGSATIPYWQFADNQWDYLGMSSGQNSSNSDVDRDLFGWGTSGYNHGAVCYRPWSTSTNNSDYYAYGNYSYDLGDLTGKADWGYNPISNGGNTPNTWRTLTNDEWAYLFNTRNTDSGVRYVKAKVNNVNGLILLPDNWNTAYHSLNNINPTGNIVFDSNVISYSEWISDFQPHGAVFLPAGGYRNGTAVSSGFDGNYWSASSLDNQFAGHAGFNNGGVYFGGGNDRRCGFSVRLVCNAE